MAVQITNNISGGNIRLRLGFNAEMAERHAESVKVASKVKSKEYFEINPSLVETELLYYQNSFGLNLI